MFLVLGAARGGSGCAQAGGGETDELLQGGVVVGGVESVVGDRFDATWGGHGVGHGAENEVEAPPQVLDRHLGYGQVELLEELPAGCVERPCQHLATNRSRFEGKAGAKAHECFAAGPSDGFERRAEQGAEHILGRRRAVIVARTLSEALLR